MISVSAVKIVPQNVTDKETYDTSKLLLLLGDRFHDHLVPPRRFMGSAA